MGMCIYVRIDTNGNRRNNTALGGKLIYHLQLGKRLHMKASYTLGEGQSYLLIGLSHTRIDNFIGSKSTRQGKSYFTTTHTIGTKPASGYKLQQIAVTIGLECIMNNTTLRSIMA